MGSRAQNLDHSLTNEIKKTQKYMIAEYGRYVLRPLNSHGLHSIFNWEPCLAPHVGQKEHLGLACGDFPFQVVQVHGPAASERRRTAGRGGDGGTKTQRERASVYRQTIYYLRLYLSPDPSLVVTQTQQ